MTTGGDETPESRLASLGLELPPAAQPRGSYATAVQTGDTVWLSGHGAVVGGRLAAGRIGHDFDVSQGGMLARNAMLEMLAGLRQLIGSLDRVAQIGRLHGMIFATATFTDHALVLDPASDLLLSIFGERGRHARSAVGMASLPFGIPLELEMVLQVRE